MDNYSIEYQHFFNIVFINTTNKSNRNWEELVFISKEKQREDDTTITEITLSQYSNRNIEDLESVLIIDLINMVTRDFTNSSVYFLSEQQHIESIRKLIVDNPHRFDYPIAIKALTEIGYAELYNKNLEE